MFGFGAEGKKKRRGRKGESLASPVSQSSAQVAGEAAEDEAGAGTLKGRPWGRSWPGFCSAGSGQVGDSRDLPINALC